MGFKPSILQQAIYDFIEKGTGHAVIAAVAGSGKTTTIVNAMKLIPMHRSSHFFAFNSTIAKELKNRIPKRPMASASTIHSYGLKAILAKVEVTNMNEFIDANKYSKIFDATYFDTPDSEESAADVKARVMPMVDLARVNLAYMPDDVHAMSEKYGLAVSMDDCRLVVDIIQKGVKKMDAIDFTDMIFLPVYHDLDTKQFDYVFVDECQDLSECQRALVLKALRPKTGRFVAVGDKQQAIYGFTGADAESFDKLTDHEGVTQLPLSVCYRCGSKIIELAQSIVPQIEAFEGSGEGEIVTASVNDIKAGDMILCRNTYPLVKLGFQYIASGVKAVIVGRDIGTNLVNMIRKTKAGSFDAMYEKFAIEQDKIVRDLVRLRGVSEEDAKKSQKYENYQDKIDAIRVIGEGCGDLDEIIAKIEGIFGDEDKDAITLSTIHKAKGLEADNVYIIHQELMPSKNAELEWEKQQEQNLMYVAYTRAKKKLGFVNDFNAFHGEVKIDKQKIEAKPEQVSVEVKEGQMVDGEFTIKGVFQMTTTYGTTKKYTLVRADGLTVYKIGSMSNSRLVSGGKLEEGAVVRLKAPVKQIGEFRGQKEISLGMLEQL